MKLRPIPAAAILLLSGALSLAQVAQAQEERRSYLIQLADKPAATYTGGVAGLAATQPPSGQRIDPGSATLQLYTDYLGQKQAAIKALVPAAEIEYDYKVVLNGFSARLTDAEVRALQANSAVLSIQANAVRQLDTAYTPTFLGLEGAGGLWAQAGGKQHAGENVIIGVIDSGIWPENPAYADRIDASGLPTFDNSATLAYTAPVGWTGTCQTGEAFTAANCNNKLIGARFFRDGFERSGETQHWSEFISPRDSIGGSLGKGGHGTHTSSTAAGNNGVAATLGGMAMGSVSGMAPRARVAMYKVCWTYVDGTTPGKNSCWEQDSIAAIEQAVLDGVHVLNYSISGGTSPGNSVELAFLNATAAGVFVAASGGNDGPAQAVNHVGPWLTTVAAAAHDQFRVATLALGNGASYAGASLSNTVLPSTTPIIRSEDAALPGTDPNAARLCFSAGWIGAPVLDPNKVRGKIVTCERGTNDRVDKSLAVAQAEGAGMVMVDNGSGLVVELHSVPTVHVSAADGAAIKAYALAGGGTASLSRFFEKKGTGPIIAGFSSRGPNAADGNLLKPDLAAPGVDILAAVAPELSPAQQASLNTGTLTPVPNAWALYGGTSMAAPHVAGIAALLRQAYPDWSPAAIKSALMTSATQTFPDTQPGLSAGVLPWAQGAGHINPRGGLPAYGGTTSNATGAIAPGLVYDIAPADYRKYLCGSGVSSQCSSGTLVGYNLNVPSITLANVLGNVTVARTVTNVGTTASTYTAQASVPGYTTVVTPASLTLAPGQSASFTLKLTRGAAPDNVWQYGALTWKDGSHIVRIPVTARSGKPISAPALLASVRPAGSMAISVGTGFSGRMNAYTGGFKAVTKGAPLTVTQAVAPVDTPEEVAAACNDNDPGAARIPVSLPANTVVAAFELFNNDTAHGAADDLDMVVLDASGELVDYSGTGGSNEAIVLKSPAAGSYTVCVVGWKTPGAAATTFRLSSAVALRGETTGNLRAGVPSQVYLASTASVSASWSGLASGQRYYGGIQLLDTSGGVGATTALLVETNSPIPQVQHPDRSATRVARK
ncbi:MULTISPECIES: S8 family peptidase [unclassified Duganella]|uniref:S8 family peptidase n=1 Tax=unclassified Duganella TaxID=2636909 RepID=UPI0008873AA7|nr:MULTISPECIES: S8 family peptidase [unclassified Duganella]SDH36800.1 Peptidase inhibitor I9 [Duganella sp. OV458]SDK53160.1 Peptidase inhibitor I9 [Duganella sp. OV510]